jgi:hypothetical protein
MPCQSEIIYKFTAKNNSIIAEHFLAFDTMAWLLLLLGLIGHLPLVQASCSPPVKFYIDCGGTRTAGAASQFCLSHGMTLVNLTNGTTSLPNDVTLLNNTFKAKNCNGNFWFSSGTRTNLVASTNALFDLLGALTNVVGAVLCIIPFLCPEETTLAPIVNAFTVCTRPIQQRLIQKCLMAAQRPDMLQFRFREQSMYAGVLDTLSSRSSTTCSALCAANDACIGMFYNDGTCTLYM